MNRTPTEERSALQEPALAPKPAESPFFNPYIQILFCVALSGAAQLLMKRGAVESIPASEDFSLGFAGLHSLWVWAGIVCLVTSLVSWLYALRFVPLIVAFNLAGLLHVVLPIASWLLLGETIGMRRWFGIALVFVGVLIVARPIIKMEEQ